MRLRSKGAWIIIRFPDASWPAGMTTMSERRSCKSKMSSSARTMLEALFGLRAGLPELTLRKRGHGVGQLVRGAA